MPFPVVDFQSESLSAVSVFYRVLILKIPYLWQSFGLLTSHSNGRTDVQVESVDMLVDKASMEVIKKSILPKSLLSLLVCIQYTAVWLISSPLRYVHLLAFRTEQPICKRKLIGRPVDKKQWRGDIAFPL